MSTFAGASLLIAWQLKDKQVLIVGGGDVASGRLESVLPAGPFVTVVCPRERLHPTTQRLIRDSDRVKHLDRLFSGPEDLTNFDMVLTAIDDVERSREICDMCRDLKIPVNAADIPPLCDFYFGSQIRDGPLQILISTNGQSPKLANIIRTKIERCLPQYAGEAIQKVGMLRMRLKERVPGVGGAIGKRRMKWMVEVCTSWKMEELALLDEQTIKALLDNGWEKNAVPTFEELGGKGRALMRPFGLDRISPPVVLAFLAGAACTTLLLSSRWHR